MLDYLALQVTLDFFFINPLSQFILLISISITNLKWHNTHFYSVSIFGTVSSTGTNLYI